MWGWTILDAIRAVIVEELIEALRMHRHEHRQRARPPGRELRDRSDDALQRNLAEREDRLDDSVNLSAGAFVRDVTATERFLERAKSGTRVVTYCGWGGSMPAGYELVLRERAGTLDLWTKTGS